MSDPAAAADHCRQSNALLQRGQFAAAETAARQAVALHASNPAGHLNLAAALHQQGRIEDAIASYESALSLKPDWPLALSNLSDALARIGRLDEAEAAARRAMELEPRSSTHPSNLATVLLRQGRTSEALQAARDAIALDPHDDWAHANIAIALLTLGRLEEAWPHYEHRPHAQTVMVPARKLWNGSPLDGRSIALRTEQGFGDAIMFIRFAQLVHGRGGGVHVECAPPLKDLLATADGVQSVHPWGERAADAELEIPLLSVPHRLGVTMQSLPTAPYLRADPERAQRLRQLMRDDGNLKIGVAWAGNPRNSNDRVRSCPIGALEPLSRLAKVTLCSLQKGDAADRDADAARGMNMVDIGRACENFADLAAAMSLLDLVIGVDSAPVHVAGAIGKPAIVLLSAAADWQWMQNTRDDSPWYPTARLLRQNKLGDWTDVIAGVVEHVNRLHSLAK